MGIPGFRWPCFREQQAGGQRKLPGGGTWEPGLRWPREVGILTRGMACPRLVAGPGGSWNGPGLWWRAGRIGSGVRAGKEEGAVVLLSGQ